jgi:hypothetical protein
MQMFLLQFQFLPHILNMVSKQNFCLDLFYLLLEFLKSQKYKHFKAEETFKVVRSQLRHQNFAENFFVVD